MHLFLGKKKIVYPDNLTDSQQAVPCAQLNFRPLAFIPQATFTAHENKQKVTVSHAFDAKLFIDICGTG